MTNRRDFVKSALAASVATTFPAVVSAKLGDGVPYSATRLALEDRVASGNGIPSSVADWAARYRTQAFNSVKVVIHGNAGFPADDRIAEALAEACTKAVEHLRDQNKNGRCR